MKNPPIEKRSAYLAIAFCCALMAIYHFINPPLVRPDEGRWSSFFGWIWDIFGASGIQGYWALLAAIFFGCYFGTKK